MWWKQALYFEMDSFKPHIFIPVNSLDSKQVEKRTKKF